MEGSHVQGITFQNTNFAFSARAGAMIEMCGFEGAPAIGMIVSTSDGLKVTQCMFRACGNGLASPTGSGNSNLEVVDSQFIDISALGIDFEGVSSGVISGCLFSGNRVPIQVAESDDIVIESCETVGATLNACVVASGTAALAHNQFGPAGDATLALIRGAVVQAWDNHVSAGGVATIFIGSRSQLTFSNGFIQHGDAPSVLVDTATPVPPTHDLRNNYWGTVDLAQIEEWITDGNDNPFLSIVEFEPILTSSVPTQRESMSVFRARFGQ